MRGGEGRVGLREEFSHDLVDTELTWPFRAAELFQLRQRGPAFAGLP